MIAQVAVSAAVYAIDKPYTYAVPDSISLQVGMRVTVPFGRGNRRSEAIVLSLCEGDGTGLKFIERVMDDQPVLTSREIRLAAFIRQRYFCTFYDAIRAVLPAGVWLSSSVVYEKSDKDVDPQTLLKYDDMVQQIYRLVDDLGGKADLLVLKRIYHDAVPQLEDAIRILVDCGLLKTNLDIVGHKRDKTEKIISLAISVEEAEKYALQKKKSAPLQYEVLQFLSTAGSVSSKELCYYTGASPATLRRLEELGYVSSTLTEVFRTSLPKCVKPADPVVLTAAQQCVYDGLRDQMTQAPSGTALLYGVTGSGKTSVYIRLIQDVLQNGQGAILLVPEISLTPQLLTVLVSHFGEQTAVLHSGLRVTERYDTWKKIRSGKCRVVVGTRSAVFAPVNQLGLIILDEEQEHTYKSENSPRYHAREIALYRGAMEGAFVLMGSATPSVETMYKAVSGQFALYKLEERYNGRELPAAEIVDMKEEIRSGNSGEISEPLRLAMEDAFFEHKQAILFLNRRGAGKYRICVTCGAVPSCPRCSVNLTYHLANRRLMCHHCGYSESSEELCPQCGGHLKTMGTGTQRVEQELFRLFPDREVLRMDADTISARSSHEALLSRFEKEHIPVLLGTQMIAKGLNFDDVTVVGVIDADQALYSGSFRAAETAFSMITQVVGRSGRGASTGHAYIQSMTPENPVIVLAARQDYDAFYEMEISVRQLMKTPPFSDIFQITFVGPTDDQTATSAGRFRTSLINALRQSDYRDLECRILGPAPAPILKINNAYRYRMILSCVNQKSVRLLIAHLLREFVRDKQNRGISALADVNPFD